MARLKASSYLLAPLSWIYALGWEGYEAMYRLGILAPQHPHHPSLCLGNLQVGGTGKTPVIMFLSQLLIGWGRSVAIGASGYGSPGSRGAQIAPSGELDPSLYGDEPAMLRWLLARQGLGDVPILVGRDRVRAAELCHEHFPEAVLLMDDGFQHLRLRADVNLVLDPESANRFCIPAGPYREPRDGIRRADTVLPGRFRVEWSVPWLESSDTQTAPAPKSAAVVTAIASPERVLASVAEMGIEVRATKFLRDHDPLSAGTLWNGLPRELPVVVTAKDWVKLRMRADLEGRLIYIIRREASIQPVEEFSTWLRERIDTDPSQEL